MLSILFSIGWGSTDVSIHSIIFSDGDSTNRLLIKLRMARSITAFTTGALLSLAGTLMQLLLQNPLADPYILGVSSGAAIGTLLLMLLGVSESFLLTGAWLGSLVSMCFILLLTKKHRWQPYQLLLTGISLACGLSACISFILLISPSDNLPSLLFWLSGDLNKVSVPWPNLIILIGGALICLLLTPGLDILSRGIQHADALGLDTKRYQIILFFLSSLFTAAAVTLGGCIGFVGILVPHIVRLIGGYQHAILIPVSFLLGGSLVTIADTIARTIAAPQQIPVGIIIALLGVPLFIGLLQK